MIDSNEWEDGFPTWYVEDPDSTTDLIINIDAELNRTMYWRERIQTESFCLVCSKPGAHVHTLEVNGVGS
jgi:hypothetical protein